MRKIDELSGTDATKLSGEEVLRAKGSLPTTSERLCL